MKGSLALYYRIIKTDSKGRIIKKGRLRRSHSFLKQYPEILLANFNDLMNSEDVKDVGGGLRDLTEHDQNLRCEAAANDATLGIVAGTSNTAVTLEDYVMGAQITHGTGGGQLSYGAMTIGDPAVVGANVDMVLSRVLSNGSGGTITVRETGLIVYGNAYKMLIVRDVLASPEAVNNGQAITIEYTLRTTV
jgi:hypothetical protein